MLMELIGNELMSDPTKYKLNNISTSSIDGEKHNASKQYPCILESIHITYLSQGKNDLTFHTEINDKIYSINSQSVELNVKALGAKGRTISEGILRYQRC